MTGAAGKRQITMNTNKNYQNGNYQKRDYQNRNYPNRNYQKELDKITADIDKKKDNGNADVPTLFLHSCCAPCSSYVLEYLRRYFRITVFYYNPNITEEPEYRKRVAEQKRLIAAYNKEAKRAEQNSAAAMQRMQETQDKDWVGGQGDRIPYEIEVTEGEYEPERFYEIARGLEQCPEGGERCFACYALRLRETAKRAQAGGYDYFTTTLTISPLKNAAKLNEIGERLAQEYGVAWLPSDFKKKNGYKRSVELSREYELYRQDYCGCVYSRMQREQVSRVEKVDKYD